MIGFLRCLAHVSGVDFEALPSSVGTVRDVQNWTVALFVGVFSGAHQLSQSFHHSESDLQSESLAGFSTLYLRGRDTRINVWFDNLAKAFTPSRLTETSLVAMALLNLKRSPQVTFSFWGLRTKAYTIDSLRMHGTRMNRNVLVLLT
jgi:hypothetical protein